MTPPFRVFSANGSVPSETQPSALTTEETDLLLIGLTHDMRSPLFAVLGYLQLLQRQLESGSADQALAYTRLAHQAGTRLDHMITEVLDLIRFGHRPIELHKRPMSGRALFERLWGTFQVIASQKKVHLRMVMKGSEDLVLHADPALLERALDNLLANAVKFSPTEGEVFLTAYQDSNRNYFEVTDRGRGIPKEEQFSIFEPYRQAPSGDREGGFGLGLTIVRFIAKAHGGDVEVLSNPGSGTRFILWLPA